MSDTEGDKITDIFWKWCQALCAIAEDGKFPELAFARVEFDARARTIYLAVCDLRVHLGSPDMPDIRSALGFCDMIIEDECIIRKITPYDDPKMTIRGMLTGPRAPAMDLPWKKRAFDHISAFLDRIDTDFDGDGFFEVQHNRGFFSARWFDRCESDPRPSSVRFTE